MTSFPPDDHLGSTPDHDFREALIQAMDSFATDAHAPAIDGTAILRRTRRRRGVLAVTASAAAIVLAAGTAFALNGSGEPPARPSAAAPGGSATPAPATPSPAVPEPTASGSTATASPGPPTGTGTPMGTGTPSPGADTRPGPGEASVTVPSVIGMSQAQAEKLLTEAGLKIDRVQQFTDWKTSVGAVISTEPRPGAVVAPSTAVVVFVSKGKP
ncbi:MULTISPECIES: PASTA domain-containing protein [Kitasatospora]|uniref:PASTA domain-containing protein n=1 Tax=Kitasatospora cystarginea TaxID=58350 RepID=A0ABN3DPQ9_9ACTN